MSKFACAKLTVGQLNAIVKKLGGHEGAMLFLCGQAEVVVKKHSINLAADPHVPGGWSVVEHQPGPADWEWSPEKVRLHLEPEQESGYLKGEVLRERLKGTKHPFNANLLDYLLAHLDLIPEAWKGKAVFFWGTTYRDSDGGLCVRYLGWFGDGWGWSRGWLEGGWRASYPAAVSAS